jgi:hypothetical protein
VQKREGVKFKSIYSPRFLLYNNYIYKIEMKSILLTAILATVGFASKVSVLSYNNAATPIDFGFPADFGTGSAQYDINFGYGLEGAIEQGDSEGIMDAWVQASLWSNVDLVFNFNLWNT